MTTAPAPAGPDTAVVAAVERRVLWLATAIVHHANRVRRNPSGLKVGGHQASSASMATIMTELWFRHLRRAGPGVGQAARLAGAARDQLPARRAARGLPDHAARVRRAAELPEPREGPGPGRLLDRLGRDRGDRADLGCAGPPLRGQVRTRPATGRQYSLLGDAELDEGACWEAVLDPMVGELGEVVWVVDLNRQSLDRVVPILGATRLQGMFAAAGWQVLTVKYGHLLQELFTRPGGDALRARIDEMSNPEYQRLLRCTDAAAAGPPARRRSHDDADLRALVDGLDDATLRAAIRNLGGHDLDALGEAFRAIDDTRPTVIFAYTVKGTGWPPRGTRRTTRRCSPTAQFARARRAARDRPGRPVGAVPGRLGRGRAVREHRRPAAPRPGAGRRAARRPGRPRPHPVGHRDHPGRARPRAARPHPAAPRTPPRAS